MATFIGQPNTNNIFVGTAASDTFRFAANDLNANDILEGGGGDDRLWLYTTTAGVLGAGALANMSGVENISLVGSTTSLTLVDNNLTGVAGARIKIGGGGDDMIDASGLTGINAVQIFSGGGLDSLTGGAGADEFRFAAADLAGDTVQGGGGFDRLQLTTAGIVSAAALANVSGVEAIALVNGTNSLALANANFAGVTGAKITVTGNTGNDTIDASGVSGANAVDFRSGSGLDSLTGGAGADEFRFTATDLDGDTIQGGDGNDRLYILTAGVLGAGALANMSGVENISLVGSSTSLTLIDDNLTGVAGAWIRIGGGGDDTIDASGLTGTNAVQIYAGGGADMLLGGAGADEFRFVAADLAGDTVQGGGGSDVLRLTTAGVLGAAQLANVSGVEAIVLASGNNTLSLQDTNFADVTDARIAVSGATGTDTVDGSALTGSNALDITSGAGLDVLRGGAGDDTFRFRASELAGDTIQGGDGNDLLQLTTAGLLGAGALANMTGVETIALADGTNRVTLADGNFAGVAGGKITVLGGSGADTIDGSGLSSGNLLDITAGGGTKSKFPVLDVLRGGAGDDTFRYDAGALNGDTVQGGDGIDLLQLTTAGQLGAGALANVTGVETIALADGTNQVTLADGNFVGVDGTITVLGGSGADTIDGSGLSSDNSLDITAGGGYAGKFRVLDVLKGGAGHDVFRYDASALDGDTIEGGDGFDTLYLLSSGLAGKNPLANMTGVERITLAAGQNDVLLTDANFAVPLASAVLIVDGTAGHTNVYAGGLTGSNAVGFIDGGGIDTIIGGSGDDVIVYYSGNLAAAGDTFYGGAGIDTIVVDRSMDFLGDIVDVESLLYYDYSSLSSGANVTISGANAARLSEVGSSIYDGLTVLFSVQLAADSTTDLSALTLIIADEADRIEVSSSGGNTAVTLSSQIGRFNGSADSDQVGYASGGSYNNSALIYGGNGNDRIVHGASADIIDGGEGNDTLVLVAGGFFDLTGTVYTGNYSDFENIDGSASNGQMTLRGRDDVASVLITGTHNDFITGGAGGSFITGGLGRDRTTGGSGQDVFRIASTNEAGGDTIDGRGGYDRIEVRGNTDLTDKVTITNIEALTLAATDAAGNPVAADVTVTVFGAQAAALTDIRGNGAFADTVETLVVKADQTVLDLSSLNFLDWGGNDHLEIIGTAGNETIIGSSTNDVITSGGGIDSLSGEGGDDVIDYVLGFAFQTLFGFAGQIDGGTGNDTIKVQDFDIDGFSRIDVDLAAGTITENFDGGGGATFNATNFENADFSQSSVFTQIAGSTAVNVLIGGFAADFIYGDQGADTLTGNGGADQFAWGNKLEGGDTIADFVAGTDKLVFGFSSDAQQFFTNATFDSAAAVRSYVDDLPGESTLPMFFIAANSAGHTILYYTDDASNALTNAIDPSGLDRTFYEIVDLGTVTASQDIFADFVFV